MFIHRIYFLWLFHNYCQASISLWVKPGSGQPLLGRIDYQYQQILDTLNGPGERCVTSTFEKAVTEIENDVGCISFRKFHLTTDSGQNPRIYITYSATRKCEYPQQLGMPDIDKPGVDLQIIFNLHESCIDINTLKYYLVRILGLQDEHTRPDRDEYVSIHYNNIDDEKNESYSISHKAEGGYTGLESVPFAYSNYPYDFSSITHFGPFENGKDPSRPTISSHASFSGVTFGERRHFSEIDIRKLQDLYKCEHISFDKVKGSFQPVQCNFDLPLCNLVDDDTGSGLSWFKTSGPVSTEGPQTDHSNGAGSYMFANGTSHGGNARLVSITETSRGKVCVSLFYCLLGNSTLRVLQQDSMSGNITVIDQRENTFNSTARSWMPLQISHEASTIWRLVIEAEVLQGGVAVDDVHVEYKECESPKTCV
ncbi:meprin A subunit alpha-like [Ostrea edulis]|uniref:meprin A subunit alpha-like n=1 Tax=Ostrea edulis TaxID=37623 RepID=UPI0024AEB476|nr:meprin A subunit alpha-like [Ostrea edulis]